MSEPQLVVDEPKPVEKSGEQRVAECIAELDGVLRKHRCGMRAAARQRTDPVGDGSGLLVKAETKIEVVPLP